MAAWWWRERRVAQAEDKLWEARRAKLLALNRPVRVSAMNFVQIMRDPFAHKRAIENELFFGPGARWIVDDPQEVRYH